MRVSAKADYAVRALVELAAADASEQAPAKGELIAAAQAIPMRFLENILAELRVHGLVHSRRGSDGGYWLAQAPDEITLAEVIRAVEGPLATVRGEAPDEIEYPGGCEPLRDVWLALRANVRGVLESVTLADVVAAELPAPIPALSQRPEARTESSTSDPPRRPGGLPRRAGGRSPAARSRTRRSAPPASPRRPGWRGSSERQLLGPRSGSVLIEHLRPPRLDVDDLAVEQLELLDLRPG